MFLTLFKPHDSYVKISWASYFVKISRGLIKTILIIKWSKRVIHPDSFLSVVHGTEIDWMFQSPTLFMLKDHFWNQNASVKAIERAREIKAFQSSCIHRSFPRSCLDFWFQSCLKIDTLEGFIALFLHQESWLCYFHWRWLKALSQSQNDKLSFNNLFPPERYSR